MLVWDRRKDQGIVIDDSIIVTVLKVYGDKVRLGIENARSVYRGEKPIRKTEQEAKGPSPNQTGEVNGPG